jgi:hypothetical protein
MPGTARLPGDRAEPGRPEDASLRGIWAAVPNRAAGRGTPAGDVRPRSGSGPAAHFRDAPTSRGRSARALRPLDVACGASAVLDYSPAKELKL